MSYYKSYDLCFALASCGSDNKNNDDSSSKSKAVVNLALDYENAEDFEEALNNGEKLEGCTVRIKVKEFHPESKLGYNIWAGEHLNFISSDNPDVKEGDSITIKVTKVENMLGSWIIKYKKIGD